jgi:hypothetical protein
MVSISTCCNKCGRVGELFIDKFNKVVSSFMILLNQNKNKSLTSECKKELIDLIEIYMPSIKSKIN